MTLLTKKTGELGEKIATNFLIDKGFKILEKNFKTKFGEIDIIAEKNLKIHFVEVKTRIGIQKGYPWEAVNLKKRKHLQKALLYYQTINEVNNAPLSVDVISIVLKDENTLDKLDFYETIDI